jgi:hypothetical protein
VGGRQGYHQTGDAELVGVTASPKSRSSTCRMRAEELYLVACRGSGFRRLWSQVDLSVILL